MDKLVKFTTIEGIDIAIRPDQVEYAYVDKKTDGTSELIVETNVLGKFALAIAMDDFLYQIS